MTRTLAFLLALAVGAPVLQAADEPTTLRLTLAEAVERARASSARIAQLASLQKSADEGLRGARAARLPQLDLSASYTRQSDVPELAIISPGPPPQRLTVFPNIPDVWRTRAGLLLPLYTGGRIRGAIDSAHAQADAAARDLESGENDLVLETRTAYWALVAALESERVLREAIAAFEAHLRDARNRQEVGMAASNEVLAVQVERDRAELNRLQAENAAAVTNANLLRLLDLSPGTRIEPTEPLAAPAAAPEDERALVERALSGRPEIAALRRRIAAAEAAVRLARSASLPQAGLQAGYDLANPNSRILPLVAEWKGTWNVGVQLSWSAFDGGKTAAAAAQAEAQAEAARHQLDDLERRVRLEVESRLLDARTAVATLAVAERNLSAADENLRVARDRYQEGVLLSSELTDAETAKLRAGLDRTQALVELHAARAGLDRAAGR